MTTIAAFAAAVAGLTVTGVTRKYDHRPAAINDLPAQYVELPAGGYDQGAASSTNYDGKTRTLELVIALKAINQDNVEPNFDATVAMMDAVEAAIDAADLMPIINYDLTSGGRDVGGIGYWTVTARITGQE